MTTSHPDTAVAWADASPAHRTCPVIDHRRGRDTSGAVLPGVTVEASSDVLIEKVRSRSPTTTACIESSISSRHYAVTFTLPGFRTFKRDGVELAGDFNATVNAECRVGGLEETITVTGESPIVDVQSARRQRTLGQRLGRRRCQPPKGYAAVMVLIPSMVQSGGGVPNVQLSPGMVVFGGRGGRGNEGRAQVDGLNTGASLNGGGVSVTGRTSRTRRRFAITTAGGLGETEVGGPTINIVPRTGGNTFRSHVFFTGSAAACRRATSPRSCNRRDCARRPRPTTSTTPATRSAARSSGQDLVLFPRLLPRQREHDPRHVLQPERMGPDEVELAPDRPGPRFQAAAARCSRHSASPSRPRHATS